MSEEVKLSLTLCSEMNWGKKISRKAGLFVAPSSARFVGEKGEKLSFLLTDHEKIWNGVEGMFFTYVLFSLKDRKLYVGYSSNVFARFDQHRSGQVAATMNRRPLELIYYEAYQTDIEAKRRERYLKGGNGRETLKRQIDITLKRLGYGFL